MIRNLILLGSLLALSFALRDVGEECGVGIEACVETACCALEGITGKCVDLKDEKCDTYFPIRPKDIRCGKDEVCADSCCNWFRDKCSTGAIFCYKDALWGWITLGIGALVIILVIAGAVFFVMRMVKNRNN